MSSITTRVLDTTQGRPVRGMPVALELQLGSGRWKLMATGITDADGRCRDLIDRETVLAPSVYRLTFDAAGHFKAAHVEALLPFVQVAFEVKNPSQPYHVTLLLSPHGYTMYSGT